MSYIQRQNVFSSMACCLLLLAALTGFNLPSANAQRRAPSQSSAAQSAPTLRLRWSGQSGVARYRLQLARDAAFTDIVFDRAVMGREYTVRELPAGNYFWRVAPAAGETGAYSMPVPVSITTTQPNIETPHIETPSINMVSTPNRPSMPRLLQPPANVGWRTATGNVQSPLAAHLHDATRYDLAGVNTDGTVYALNGANGVAMWTARFRPGARRGEVTGNGGAPAFAPVVVTSAQKPLANLVVAYDGGVRSLDGATGRELWRAPISGRASSGVSIDMDGDGSPEIAIIDDATPSLLLLNGDTGGILSQTKLDASALGIAALNTSDEHSLALALSNGVIEVRGSGGKRLRTIKLDATITTAPLIVRAANSAMLLIGTDKGLIALNAADLHPLWRVATDKADAPRGTLAAADLDGDGMPEALMITRSGRAVAINVGSGKIRWYAEGATDAASAAFADLNGDNALDVILAAGPSFAIGLSGRDGSLIWRAEETGSATQSGSRADSGRILITAPVNGNSTFVVGNDPTRVGLRAVGLPSQSAAMTLNR